MDFKTNFADIGAFISNYSSIIIIIAIIGVVAGIACAVITKIRNGFVEDVVFAGIFGLVFNIFGLLFVIFRKPVWNNLGWIPVVAAWFLFDGNLAASLICIAYSIIWAISQHELLERIKVIEE